MTLRELRSFFFFNREVFFFFLEEKERINASLGVSWSCLHSLNIYSVLMLFSSIFALRQQQRCTLLALVMT